MSSQIMYLDDNSKVGYSILILIGKILLISG
jgi:hypothetical protein